MKSIESLKERLSANNTLVVQNERGFVSEAGFIWNKPATQKIIEDFMHINKITLPSSYIDFLKIANGATLFKDTQYGQWGCKILGLEELITTNELIKSYGVEIQDSWLIFATWYGDGDILVFDLEKYANKESNYILDGDQGYSSDNWNYIHGGFDKWLDRLIVSQGAKYWRWY